MYSGILQLFQALQAQLTLFGVTLLYGEESQNDQSGALPLAIMVPVSGTYVEPGYAKAYPSTRNFLVTVKEDVDFYLWAYNQTDDTPIGHTQAAENLRQVLIQACFNQLQTGASYNPKGHSWLTMNGANGRYGRGMKIRIQFDLVVPDIAPDTTTITTTEIDSEIDTVISP